ncbi:MAG: DUF6021 family protein [Paucimonas sp.]|nr:DUF6021 family protein [Paucimonas sp.]
MSNDKPRHPQGPHSSEHSSGKENPGFDPDSPDLDDPQVDPAGPAKAPQGGPDNRTGKRS